jgi:hypothetical protein
MKHEEVTLKLRKKIQGRRENKAKQNGAACSDALQVVSLVSFRQGVVPVKLAESRKNCTEERSRHTLVQIRGSHGTDNVDCSILGCDAV